MIGIKNFEEALKKAYFRKYDLYYVSFVKHRQLNEIEFRSFGKAVALYRRYKKRYKSATFRVSVAPVLQVDKLFSKNNPLLRLIQKNSDLPGNVVKTPIKYRGR